MSLNLQAVGIDKSYDNNQVLQDCSWSFTEHGIYVLTGVNGCGKSTFLRICALLERPDKGEVRYLDGVHEAPDGMTLMRRITLVLPKAGLFNMSVSRNVSYGLRIRGISGRESNDRTDSVLEFTGLSHKKDQNALTLSSGEAQRVAMARALVIEPEVLFLDEPTASIDEKNTGIIENIILQLKQRGQTTVIMTTHDRVQAERVADRVLLLEGGKIVE
ncbi:MAG: ATP-binding cassette domain-containing protein [Nitrospirae bacterium]|nr:ATP-binding cassette domain-containing protein [Nitrospirota bacterium]